MNITDKRKRTRYTIKLHSDLPRVSVHKTNQYFSAQIVEKGTGKVLNAIHEKSYSKASKETKLKPVELVAKMGEEFGKNLLCKKIERVVYDRSGYIYHGKVKAFAEGMRKAGVNL